jgi:hypothetical protein
MNMTREAQMLYDAILGCDVRTWPGPLVPLLAALVVDFADYGDPHEFMQHLTREVVDRVDAELDRRVDTGTAD